MHTQQYFVFFSMCFCVCVFCSPKLTFVHCYLACLYVKIYQQVCACELFVWFMKFHLLFSVSEDADIFLSCKTTSKYAFSEQRYCRRIWSPFFNASVHWRIIIRLIYCSSHVLLISSVIILSSMTYWWHDGIFTGLTMHVYHWLMRCLHVGEWSVEDVRTGHD